MKQFHLDVNQFLNTDIDLLEINNWEQLQEIKNGFVNYNNNYYMITDGLLKQATLIDNSVEFHVAAHALYEYSVVLVAEHDEIKGYLSVNEMLPQLVHHYQTLLSYFTTITKTSEASVTVINDKREVILWTEGAERIFSLPHEKIQGDDITNHFEEDKLAVTDALYRGQTLQQSHHLPRKNVFVLINTSPVYVNGKIVGAVASETDITSQVKLNRELMQASERIHRLEQNLQTLQPSDDPFREIKGQSPPLEHTKRMIEKLRYTDVSVLILGESGVGKELFAKAIHETRETKDSPFIAINCGAIPNALFESELFGYERGAFSGADQKGKKGKFELARNGTLFLDEIAEMPLDMQVKLLRVLQDKKYFAVGGSLEIQANFRVIAATNRDLDQLVEEGLFREDLYYRLNVVNLTIPPLRERKEDIVQLVHHFLYELSVRYHKPIPDLSPQFMNALLKHNWKGNVRELRNALERLVVFSNDGEAFMEDLPFLAKQESVPMNNESNGQPQTLQASMDLHERQLLIEALKRSDSNKQRCATDLGISRATLYNKLQKHNLE
ncbi:sigma-54 interaction domain-containing protein [Natribacillus halophilus]|uniref:PAS domain S-box-containing protein n=1 Tax=Natribacillus halophilus TaxID=549003 RepID=A0A1G8R8J1_9BACI|nr:sigma 54-interacting transcriptional regulator [Natribacillus halophilus]SDJ13259.1 PAS domain S-box-containing protein [Natribacillus halophilus]